MPDARIKDLTRWTSLDDRLEFEAPVFPDAHAEDPVGGLAWDTPVEVLERRDGRVRVRWEDEGEGWVDARLAVETRYVRRNRGRFTTPVRASETGRETLYELMWGDPVQVIEEEEKRSLVWARGGTGWVDNDHLGDEALLEVYFVDVGQGDGVLIRTPDGRHVLVDGGYRRAQQPTGKNAADFVDWKFFKDYGETRIRLDAMIASHCDADHYGGLWDLVSRDGEAREELDTEGTDVGAFHHAGVSWWNPGGRTLGPVEDGHLVRLVEDRESVVAALAPGAEPALQGWWADFLGEVVEATETVERLGVWEGEEDPVHVPGFGPGEGPATLRVLGPITRRVGGRAAVRRLPGGDSQNTNGHSVLLRLDYGSARIMLTGDLNKRSMHEILHAYEGRAEALGCDVAKGCHHGSEDVSFAFLQALRPGATVISSGDSEGHGHPRPAVVGASAICGYTEIDVENDELVTPLVYSTEVERSARIGEVERVDTPNYPAGESRLNVRVYGQDPDDVDPDFRDDARRKRGLRSWVAFEETRPGAIRAEDRIRPLHGSYVVSGVVYGLVNVRTDGRTILCATRNEADASWTVRTFRSRF